jgi:hypothetical protein
MAHFAQLDSDNIVLRVIVITNDAILNDENQEVEQKGIELCKSIYGQDTNWKKTSYNNSIRKQFAGPGFSYNSTEDIFIALQPYNSWTLNSNFDWEAPVEKPEDDNYYVWDEENLEWVILINKEDFQFNEETHQWEPK